MDMIMHAGDLVDISVLEELQKLCPEVKAVCGNMDPGDLKKKLPEKEIFNIGKFRIGMMHGYGHPGALIDLLEESFKNEGVNLVIFGHSHNAQNEKRGETIFFNPGSPTDKIFSKFNSLGIIQISDKIETQIIKI